MKLFGTSGIRMKNLTPEITYKVGFAVAQLYKSVVVGRDTRTTGELIKTSLFAGLLNGGAEVDDIGIVPTPTLGYNSRNYNIGIMITASHNPSEYNGIKLFNNDGTAFKPQQEAEIEQLIFNKSRSEYNRANWNNIKRIWNNEKGIYNYNNFILENINLNYDNDNDSNNDNNSNNSNNKNKYKVVVDCANSAGCVVSPYLFTDVGAHVISVNSHIDGRFIGRNPEPNETNLKNTINMIKGLNTIDNNNYIGIAHDGDGDRMIAIDEKGRLTDFDKLLAIFSKYIIEKTNTNIIITTVDASKCIDDHIKDLGAKVIRTKVGDVAVSEELSKYSNNQCVFGGEPSGTWIHKDIHLTPDGILSGLRLLEMIEYYNKQLYELIEEVPEYCNLREKIPCTDDKKHIVMEKVIEEGEKVYGVIVETIDGARFNLDNGWVLIRPSGTEPYIRVRVEGKSEKVAKELLNKGIELVKKFV